MRLIIILMFTTLSNFAFAGDAERTQLVNYLRELNKIDRLHESAKLNSNTNELYRFKYESFENDLKKLKDGIKAYLDAPKREPSVLTTNIEPLVGYYR